MVLCLNMGDEAARAGLHTDLKRLSQILDVPCVETVGVRRQGIRELAAAVEEPETPGGRVTYSAL